MFSLCIKVFGSFKKSNERKSVPQISEVYKKEKTFQFFIFLVYLLDLIDLEVYAYVDKLLFPLLDLNQWTASVIRIFLVLCFELSFPSCE